MADANNDTVATSCTNCGKEATAENSLRACSNCRKAHYCSRDCQRADWKQHKRACGFTPSGTSSSKRHNPQAQPNFEELLRAAMAEEAANPHSRTGAWLRDLPQAEVFKLLIDSYRLRVEDEYTFRGDAAEDSLYGGGNPVVGFTRFLQRTEAKQGILPSWWSREKREECVRIGDRRTGWSSLHAAVEKSDITEHYGNPMTPMQLRMLAEEVEGSNVMSVDSGRPFGKPPWEA